MTVREVIARAPELLGQRVTVEGTIAMACRCWMVDACKVVERGHVQAADEIVLVCPGLETLLWYRTRGGSPEICENSTVVGTLVKSPVAPFAWALERLESVKSQFHGRYHSAENEADLKKCGTVTEEEIAGIKESGLSTDVEEKIITELRQRRSQW